eukprot:TRINITY_DN13613_c0_g1_i3.p1 TRINITY_DN13613_c0_g1~~TRINITY_DN13613_c0_g1_i3.p1  ORF type:complete len:615 (-),score=124.45 TRINITY_DN13613_c0_g1_i3:366-2210(-)
METKIAPAQATLANAAHHIAQQNHSSEPYEPCTGGGLFHDIHQLKNGDRERPLELEREQFKNDIFGKIAKSKKFEFTTLGFICLNALAIGYDADYSSRFYKPKNLYEGPLQFIIIECTFATYFTAEVLIRFIAYKNKMVAICDISFLFDAVLVAMMVMETWVLPFFGDGGPFRDLSILRLVRLLRITRMARLMRSLPELLIIVRGMVAAVRAVAWTVILLVVFTFTFSILFTTEYHQGRTPDEEASDAQSLFGSMSKSFFSLIIMGTILDDVTVLTDGVRGTGSFTMMCAVLLFILISAFMLANMLLGILVEVVGISADTEKAMMKAENFRDAVGGILSRMDTNTDHFVTEKEFLAMRDHPDVNKALKELGVERCHFTMYGSLLFGEHTTSLSNEKDCGLTYNEITDMMLRLTPGQPVSALDLAAMGTVMLTRRRELHQRVRALHDSVATAVANATAAPSGAAEGSSCSADVAGAGEVCQAEAEAGKPSDRLNPSGLGPRAASNFIEGDAQNAARRIGPDTLSRLARMPSDSIIRELQGRIGVTDFSSAGVPFNMLDNEMRQRAREASAGPGCADSARNHGNAAATLNVMPTEPFAQCRPADMSGARTGGVAVC